MLVYLRTIDFNSIYQVLLKPIISQQNKNKQPDLQKHWGILFGERFWNYYVMNNKQDEIIDIGKFIAIYKKEKNDWRL
jgi:hypothetical protein